MIAVLLYGFANRVRVYDSMVNGGRDALDVAVKIVPYLVVILVAVDMFRASGALDFVIGYSILEEPIGVPRKCCDGLNPPVPGAGPAFSSKI